MKTTKVRNVETKRYYLKIMYGRKYEEWRRLVEKDDRYLFCNIYEGLMDMLDDLEYCKSSGMLVAYNRYQKEQEEILKNIIENFKDR